MEACTVLHLVQSSHDDQEPSIAAGRQISQLAIQFTHLPGICHAYHKFASRDVNLINSRSVANYQRLVNLVVKEENSPGRQTMDAKYPLDFLVTPQAKSSLQTSRRLWQKKKTIHLNDPQLHSSTYMAWRANGQKMMFWELSKLCVKLAQFISITLKS